jgi:hypothetical protein
MMTDRRSDRAALVLAASIAVGALGAGGCSDIHPEPDTAGGSYQSPTHEADALRRTEERQEQQREGQHNQ